MKRLLMGLFLVIAVAFVPQSHGQNRTSAEVEVRVAPRVLLIVAHPDDEYEMAATVYRITRELSGTVDQVIISNGEGGFRYSSLAGRYYGADLANEPVGRAKLPRIRKEEAHEAARVLGIQHQWFLNERDDRFTLDVEEVLHKTWRATRIENLLVQRLRSGHYDFVFVILPTEDTHGQHKAATILALRAVEQLPANRRPTVLGAQASPKDTDSYRALTGYAITSTASALPQFHFDRNTHFGFQNALSYQIVVDWVIAEHKSQGLFQTSYGQDRFENFWLFTGNSAADTRRVETLFQEINPTPHDPSGGNQITGR